MAAKKLAFLCLFTDSCLFTMFTRKIHCGTTDLTVLFLPTFAHVHYSFLYKTCLINTDDTEKNRHTYFILPNTFLD